MYFAVYVCMYVCMYVQHVCIELYIIESEGIYLCVGVEVGLG